MTNRKTKSEPFDWYAANQAGLMAALAEVRARLEPAPQRVSPPAGSAKKQPRRNVVSPTDASPWSALDQVCAVFGLSPFERAVLLLCAGGDLDSTFATLCAAAHGDARRTYPTFGLALGALAEPHWSALSPNRPLRYWSLIEVGKGENLTSSPLRIDERVLHFLTGVACLDQRLDGLIRPFTQTRQLPPSQQEIAAQLARWWQEPRQAAVQLCGDDREGAGAVVSATAQCLGLQLYRMDAADMPAAAAERAAFIRLWEREAIFTNSALLIECDDPSNTALQSFLDTAQGPIVAVCGEPLNLSHRVVRRFELCRPTSIEQRALWRQALGTAAAHLNGQVDSVAAQFSLGLQAIDAASREVLDQFRQRGQPGLDTSLWDACRAQSRPRLDDLAQRIEPRAGWDDLIIPEQQLQELRNIATQVRRRARVYDDWGFAGKCARGLGISALFSGASGTGKTMAAEVLANELRLDLYRIDLSAMVSKYIGETEKNLRRVFSAAEGGGAILLFDEADALFGKRSDVKDSHDRYANIEVSYLLQRMEAYCGLAILTTNMKNALDKAFMRRLRFVVQFPFPNAADRADIWLRMFPVQTPTEELDATKLARLNIAGGNIRNIALGAAFLAADSAERVRMDHLLAATRTEYAKLEKSLSEAEIGDWV